MVSPSDGAVAFSDGTAISSDGAATPSSCTVAHSNCTVAHSDGTVTPSDGALTPSDGAATPSDGGCFILCSSGTSMRSLKRGFICWNGWRFHVSIGVTRNFYRDRKSTRLNSSHRNTSRMPSSA